MSIDAIALLRIPNLVVGRDPWGGQRLIEHRANASLFHTFTRFNDTEPADELGLALRRVLGDSLDAHGDPRGILFFPDVCEPRGQNYAAILSEVEEAGRWVPLVVPDYVPVRYTSAAPGTHDALVAAMIRRLGRDRATAIDASVGVAFGCAELNADQPEVVTGYAAALDEVIDLMGPGFAAQYRESLEKKVRAEQTEARELARAHQAAFASMNARMERGEPLISQAELGVFLRGGGAQAVRSAFKPELSELARSVDVNALHEDDVGRILAEQLSKKER